MLNKPVIVANPSRRWRRLVLPLVVVLLGVGIAMTLVTTAPRAKREPIARQARLVEVMPVVRSDVVVEVEVMGTVMPAREVMLQPQVSGEVLHISEDLLPGGRLRQGQELLRIDPADYALALRQREAELAQAQSMLRIEEGQQAIAQREFELLGEPATSQDSTLMLRQPQLQSVRASVAQAQAALERARLDLQRTRIRAPFNAIVQSREVNAGTRVTTASRLATLVGTDQYWLELAVPVDQLRWLVIPGINGNRGSLVRIYNESAWGAKSYREGRVIRLAGDLESEGRMARLLVAVEDPLALQAEQAGMPVLLLNSYVRAVIEGETLRDVAEVDRSLLRDQDRIWIMDPAGRLQIRPVSIPFRNRDTVLISDGIAAGEQLVVTDLATPVEGMALRLEAAAAAQPVSGAGAP